jgi:hypothetical protein
MRISELKTSCAVFRSVLGMKIDEDFLEIVGGSADLWKKIESGGRGITASRAARIEERAGVSALWLLENKPRKKAVAVDGSDYSREFFDSFRAEKLSGSNFGLIFNAFGIVPRVMAIGEAAAQNERLAEFVVALRDCIESLRGRFGHESRVEADMVRQMQSLPPAFASAITEDNFKISGAEKMRLVVGAIKDGLPPITIQATKRGKGARVSVLGSSVEDA